MSFHRLVVPSFLLSSIPLHVYGRKNNFPSTFLGSWLRAPPAPVIKDYQEKSRSLITCIPSEYRGDTTEN